MHLEMREKNIEKTTQIINTTEREKEKNQKKRTKGKSDNTYWSVHVDTTVCPTSQRHKRTSYSCWEMFGELAVIR